MSCVNFVKYTGYVPSDKYSTDVEEIAHDIAPEEFYAKFVQLRKPVVITNILNSDEWKSATWTNNYLNNKAGDANVLVEKLEAHKLQKFGFTVPKVNMLYSEFLQEIGKKNDRFYMTTQDLEKDHSTLDDYGMPESIMSEPLISLKDDFPIRPKLLGQLIPHQISLWQGLSESGSSSGLHHDFHDNLYIVIRGRKRFRLFPPSNIEQLKTSGKPVVVYENGLIVYESKKHPGIIPVRSDGLPLAFLARMKRNKASRELNRAERELAKLESSSLRYELNDLERHDKIENLKHAIDGWEKELDDALQELLGYEDSDADDYIEDDDDDNEANVTGSGVISIHGDDSDEDSCDQNVNTNVTTTLISKVTSAISSNEDSVGEVECSEPPKCKKICLNSDIIDGEDVKECATKVDINEITSNTGCKTSLPSIMDEAQSSISNNKEKNIRSDVSNNNNNQQQVTSSKTNDHEQTLPNHFCNIELPTNTDDKDKIFSSIENYNDDLKCLVVNLKAGEALYLPASWFHEVTSYSHCNAKNAKETHRGREIADDDNDAVDSNVVNNSEELEQGSSGDTALEDHLALNYWFYPPNGSTSQQPYVDDFWKERYETIELDGGLFRKRKQSRNGNDDVICLGSDIDDNDSDEDSSDSDENDITSCNDDDDDNDENAINNNISSSHSNEINDDSKSGPVIIDEDDSDCN